MSTQIDVIVPDTHGTPHVSPGTYSPVTVTNKDTLGVIFLGLLACLLLMGWRRAEARNRKLIAQWMSAHESVVVR